MDEKKQKRKKAPRNAQADIQDMIPIGEGSHYSIFGEQALWRAVVMQALCDAASNSTNAELQKEKHQARLWLLHSNDSFQHVCDLAGYSPSYLRRKIRSALENNCRWRAQTSKKDVRLRHRLPNTPPEITL